MRGARVTEKQYAGSHTLVCTVHPKAKCTGTAMVLISTQHSLPGPDDRRSRRPSPMANKKVSHSRHGLKETTKKSRGHEIAKTYLRV